jgi:hypothetical protein
MRCCNSNGTASTASTLTTTIIIERCLPKSQDEVRTVHTQKEEATKPTAPGTIFFKTQSTIQIKKDSQYSQLDTEHTAN